MLCEIASNWEDVLYSCSYLYWSQWDLAGAHYFLKSGHIFRFLSKGFQKDLGSMTLSGQSPNLLFLSQQLWGSFHFFHYLLPSVPGEINQWQPNHQRTKDVRICLPSASQFCYFLALSFHFSYILMYSNLTCHCMFIKHSVHCLNCPLSGSNSQILKIIILESVFMQGLV